MKKLKLTKISVLFFVIILVFCGCQNSKDITKKDSEQVVVTIKDGNNIKLNEAKFYLEIMKKDFESKGGADIWATDFDGRTAEEVAKEQTLESLVKVKILNNEGKKMNLEITEEEKENLSDQKEKLIEFIGEDKMEEMNITEVEVSNMIDESIISNKVYQETTKDFVADEKILDERMQEALAQIGNEDPKEVLKKVRVHHALILSKDEDTEEDKDKALKHAEEALRRAKEGEDFEALVGEYSEDPGFKENKGEYTFTRGQMVPEFEEASFSMKEGEISELVKTVYGYHIIKLDEIIEPTQEEIDEYNNRLVEYKEQLKIQFTEEQKREAFDKNYQEWKDKAQIEINHELWDEVKIIDEKKESEQMESESAETENKDNIDKEEKDEE